ncbi:unnamed protein product [Cuscuta campestris]|uniref:Uncharacterized protein n=1 Tax=Cuscuta campestris TaxID=132261 RepID=A0A484KNF3_9ASTE|nr:unnamed protein product [Cuscuta campestris]
MKGRGNSILKETIRGFRNLGYLAALGSSLKRVKAHVIENNVADGDDEYVPTYEERMHAKDDDSIAFKKNSTLKTSFKKPISRQTSCFKPHTQMIFSDEMFEASSNPEMTGLTKETSVSGLESINQHRIHGYNLNGGASERQASITRSTTSQNDFVRVHEREKTGMFEVESLNQHHTHGSNFDGGEFDRRAPPTRSTTSQRDFLRVHERGSGLSGYTFSEYISRTDHSENEAILAQLLWLSHQQGTYFLKGKGHDQCHFAPSFLGLPLGAELQRRYVELQAKKPDSDECDEENLSETEQVEEEPYYLALWEITKKRKNGTWSDEYAEKAYDDLKALHQEQLDKYGEVNLTPQEAFEIVLKHKQGSNHQRGMGQGVLSFHSYVKKDITKVLEQERIDTEVNKRVSEINETYEARIRALEERLASLPRSEGIK